MANFKKGSAAAKAYMAKLRAAKGKKVSGTKTPASKYVNIFGQRVKVGSKKYQIMMQQKHQFDDLKKFELSGIKKIGGFESTYKNAPADVKKIIDKLDEGGNYAELKKAAIALKKKGYFMDYGLDGMITKFKKLPATKVGYRADRTTILTRATPYIKKYLDKGYTRKEAIKAANLDAAHVMNSFAGTSKLSEEKLIEIASDYAYVTSGNEDRAINNLLDPDYTKTLLPKYKAAIKAFEKKYKTKVRISGIKKRSNLHKDTKSHNVNIKVVSGYKQTPEIILGRVGSVTLLKSLAPEVKLRILRGKKVATNRITSAKDISDILKKFITPAKIETQEYALAMFLNNNNNVLGVYQFGIGGFTATIMDKRLLMAAALKLGATGLILCHNHPSGSLAPSDADKRITKNINEVAAIHDIKLLDHVILTKTGYYSFAENGII